MKLASLALLGLASGAGLAGCSSSEARPSQPAPPVEAAGTDPWLEEARARLEEARAAKRLGDHARARERATAAVDSLLTAGDMDRVARIELLAELGEFAYESGDRPTARRALERVLEVRERTMPEDHPDLLTARHRLGAVLYSVGDLHGARALLEPTVAARSRLLPEEHPALLASLTSLAVVVQELGDPQSARELLERVVATYSRTFPEDHPDLQASRLNLAVAVVHLGDLEGARALFEQVFEVRARTLPEDHPDRLKVQQNLGAVLIRLGDLQAARAHLEHVVAVSSRTLPEDHVELQRARQNLAALLQRLGDLRGARALQEQVLAVYARTLPDDHPTVQAARSGLSGTLLRLGDFRGARPYAEQLLESRVRTLPGDHPDVQAARGNLAGTLQRLGDLEGSRALYEESLAALSRSRPDDDLEMQGVRIDLGNTLRMMGRLPEAKALFEQVIGNLSHTLPEDHLQLQRARVGLAVVLQKLGELPAARALGEQALAAYARTPPEDDVDLHAARVNHAITLYSLGDAPGARGYFEQALAALSRTLAEDHPDLQTVRLSLASTMFVLEDFQGARTLQEQVVESYSRTLLEDHPALQIARMNLAITLGWLGDEAAANELYESVLAVNARTLPEEHPDLQAVRARIATGIASSGDLSGARALQEQVLAVVSRTLPLDYTVQSVRQDLAGTIAAQLSRLPPGEKDRRSAWEEGSARRRELILASCRDHVLAIRFMLHSGSAREAEEFCERRSGTIYHAIAHARGLGVLEPSPELESAAFTMSETTRAAVLASARLARAAEGSPRYAELRAALRKAGDELAGLVQRGTTGAAFEAARERREAAERELIALARSVSGEDPTGVEIDAPAVARRLGTTAAAVAFRRYWNLRLEATKVVQDARLCAFVVKGSDAASPEPARHLTLLDLGPIEPVEQAVRVWRESIGLAQGRGLGVGAAAPASGGDPNASGRALRALVLDPVLAAIGEAERILIVPDDVLHLVAFDALPLDADSTRLVGDRWRIETRAALTELWDDGASFRGGDTLLALGGIRYGGDAGAEATEIANVLRGGAWSEGFADLPATAEEAQGIAEAFERVFATGEAAVRLVGDDATRERLIELAPRARFLHVATHGWFASESIRSWKDSGPLDAQLGPEARPTTEEQVRRMSPMLLCGLALAGANSPEDELGRVPGLVTAEELAALDLSNCELAVLSACDTNVGERRAGHGVASLQRAMQMAGARSVITSLWKVPDEATKELMLDFYRRLWVEEKPKSQALWEAKKRLREAVDERGKLLYTTRDWAAWILTGEPD